MSKEVNAYLAAASGERQARLSALKSLIRKLYPKCGVSMRYRMPTFEFEEGWVAIANQKEYVSL